MFIFHEDQTIENRRLSRSVTTPVYQRREIDCKYSTTFIDGTVTAEMVLAIRVYEVVFLVTEAVVVAVVAFSEVYVEGADINAFCLHAGVFVNGWDP